MSNRTDPLPPRVYTARPVYWANNIAAVAVTGLVWWLLGPNIVLCLPVSLAAAALVLQNLRWHDGRNRLVYCVDNYLVLGGPYWLLPPKTLQKAINQYSPVQCRII